MRESLKPIELAFFAAPVIFLFGLVVFSVDNPRVELPAICLFGVAVARVARAPQLSAGLAELGVILLVVGGVTYFSAGVARSVDRHAAWSQALAATGAFVAVGLAIVLALAIMFGSAGWAWAHLREDVLATFAGIVAIAPLVIGALVALVRADVLGFLVTGGVAAWLIASLLQARDDAHRQGHPLVGLA